MLKHIIPLIIIFCLSFNAKGQVENLIADTKRKKVEIPNYTLFLHLHDMAVEYSTKLDYKTDSLLALHQGAYQQNLFDFRIRSVQTLQHVLYKSDPVIAFIDGWTFGFQMKDYLQTNEAKEYLGGSHPTMVTIYSDYEQEFFELWSFLTGRSADNPKLLIGRFAENYPIQNPYLNRTSVTDAAAQWVGEVTIGFKSGVATLTDALRNISDRVNYYTEFTPKLTEWQVERSINRIIGTDSIGPYMERSISSLDRITNRVDSLDHLIYSVTDTILTDVDRQRWETLSFMSSERKAILERFTLEREMLISQLVEERKAMQEFIHEERTSSFELMGSIISEATNQSFDRVDDMIDRLFFRVLILVAILAIGLILAATAYKKL